MTLIGMTEAARRAGASRGSIKRTLETAGVPIIQIHEKAFAVEDSDLAAFLVKRQSYAGRGRPKGSKNKPKEDQRGEKA